MRKPPRASPAGSRSRRRGAASFRMRRQRSAYRWTLGRHFGRRDDLHVIAVGITHPGTVAVGQWVRCDALDVQAFELAEQRVVVLLIGSEAQVLQLLAAVRFDHRSPAMRMAEAVEIDASVALAHVEPEFGIEALRLLELRHREHKAIQ